MSIQQPYYLDNINASVLAWSIETEKMLALPPLDLSGFTGNPDYPRIYRAFAFKAILEVLDKDIGMQLRAAIKRASTKRGWIVDADYWSRHGMTVFPGSLPAALTTLLESDKLLWMSLTSQTTSMLWDIYLEHLERSAPPHRFTRKVLLSLVQSTDPRLNALGLKLMKGTKASR